MASKPTDLANPIPIGYVAALQPCLNTVTRDDTATWQLRQTLEGHAGGVWSLAFSYDSKLLASGSYNETIRLWDTVT
jgi:WD40 repeat protein